MRRGGGGRAVERVGEKVSWKRGEEGLGIYLRNTPLPFAAFCSIAVSIQLVAIGPALGLEIGRLFCFGKAWVKTLGSKRLEAFAQVTLYFGEECR